MIIYRFKLHEDKVIMSNYAEIAKQNKKPHTPSSLCCKQCKACKISVKTLLQQKNLIYVYMYILKKSFLLNEYITVMSISC